MIAKIKKSVFATLALSMLALALSAGSASAAVVNFYTSQIDGSETPAGSFSPSALALASDGSLYVGDGAHSVIDKFDSDGKYVSQIDIGGTPVGSLYPFELAVDGSDNVYVLDRNRGTVSKFDSSGKYAYSLDGNSVPGAALYAEAIAADFAGNVFVGDPENHAVDKFDSTGKYLSRFTGNDTPIGGPDVSGGGLLPGALAVDAAGNIYVGSPQRGYNFKFDSTGKYLLTFAPGGGRGIAPGPNGDVYVSYGYNFVSHYDSAGNFLSEFDGRDTPQGAFTDNSIASTPSGDVYVADTGAGVVDFFPLVTVPDATVGQATDFANEAITFHGSVNPVGTQLTGCKFEYGPDTTYGSSVPCIETPGQIGSGASPVAVHAELSGLKAGTYHVRLAASNSDGSGRGEDTVVDVLGNPLIRSQVGEPTYTEVLLSATINPGNGATTYYFEYGPSSAYGQSTAPKVVPPNTADVNLSRPITKLTPGTSYHYRLVIENAVGKAIGADQTFTTVSLSSAQTCPNTSIRVAQGVDFLPECRAYEQVSPVAKNGVGLDQLFNPPFLSEDGNAIAYSTEKAVYPGAESTPFSPKAMSSRSASGWTTVGIDPPMNSTGVAALAYYATIALSEDLSRALVTTNAKLTPDAPSTGGTYLRQTATNNYAFLAPFDLSAQSAGKDFIGASDDLSTVVIGNTVLRQGAGTEAVALKTGGAPFPEPSATTDPDLVDAHQVSADGSRIYFTVQGAGEVGLYLRDGATTTLISRADGAPSTPVPASFVSASPDGRYVIFETGGEANLTADAVASPFANQAYRYDAETDTMTFLASGLAESGGALWGDAQTGDLYFTSGFTTSYAHAGTQHLIVEAGAPQSGPGAIQVAANGKYAAVEGVFYDAEANSAKAFPGAHLGQSTQAGAAHHRPQAILDDGTYFFDTPAALLTADVNGARDVYRYNHGKVSLLTSGTQSVDAQFLAATPDGRDVFFSTAAPLVGQDKDSVQDVYDARVNGGLDSQNPVPGTECQRDDCKATPNRGPELPFGGSEGLVDSENVKAKKHCPKGRHKVKARGKSRCVKSHHKRGKNQRAKDNRRQAR